MHNNTTEETRLEHRIPVLGPKGIRVVLTGAARRTGVSQSAIVRKAIREWAERQNNCHLCPACWEVLPINSKDEPQWHTHDDIEVTGDMWW